MNAFPSEPHIPTPQEDLPCTGCDEGSGYINRMIQTPSGPCDDRTVCDECDGTGAGYDQWLNGYGPFAESK